MAESNTNEKKSSPVVPLFVGGLIGGGIALLMAPCLVRARSSIVAAASKARHMIGKNKEQSHEGGIYCQVPEGADVCFDEGKRG